MFRPQVPSRPAETKEALHSKAAAPLRPVSYIRGNFDMSISSISPSVTPVIPAPAAQPKAAPAAAAAQKPAAPPAVSAPVDSAGDHDGSGRGGISVRA